MAIEATCGRIWAGQCILINADVIYATKCTSPNKAIVLQIPLDFVETYLPGTQRLLFLWDCDSANPVHEA